jgi:hypothetical protein
MDDASLRADCSRCIGLCCVLLAFDRGPLFAFDKGPGEACRHLDGSNRCAIHEDLEGRGLAGCVHYDCFGAGQVVTAMFAGRSWRDDQTTMREMYDAFVRVRETKRRALALRLQGQASTGI